jgi:hypothetical protein
MTLYHLQIFSIGLDENNLIHLQPPLHLGLSVNQTDAFKGVHQLKMAVDCFAVIKGKANSGSKSELDFLHNFLEFRIFLVKLNGFMSIMSYSKLLTASNKRWKLSLICSIADIQNIITPLNEAVETRE